MGSKVPVQVIFTIALDCEIDDSEEAFNIYPLGITIAGRTKEVFSGDMNLLHKAASLAAARCWYDHSKELAGSDVSEITVTEFKS